MTLIEMTIGPNARVCGFQPDIYDTTPDDPDCVVAIIMGMPHARDELIIENEEVLLVSYSEGSAHSHTVPVGECAFIGMKPLPCPAVPIFLN